MLGRRFFILALSAMFIWPIPSFARPFPENVKRSTMVPALYPSIQLDGVTRKLAVGARIWNQDNLIQVPASLPAREFNVNYTEDAQGEINRVWILTPEEARIPLNK